MIERFDRTNLQHRRAMKQLPFSYFSTEAYLSCSAYILPRNGEQLVVTQDLLSPHEFPSLFLPRKKENWTWLCSTFVKAEQVQQLKDAGIALLLEKKIATDFYYQTKDFLSESSVVVKRAKQFERRYAFKLLRTYDREGIKRFYLRWKKQKSRASLTFQESEDFFLFLLDRLDVFQVKQVYVEIGGKLVGLAWGVEHGKEQWVGLQLKVDYTYRDLSRFLHVERAKCFGSNALFTLGAEGGEKGILQYKKELHPSKEVDLFYVMTSGTSLFNEH